MPSRTDAKAKADGGKGGSGGASGERGVLEAINRIFLEALTCDNEEDLGRTCLRVAEELTGSAFGFIGEVNPMGRFDTFAISNPGWDACRIEHSQATMLITDMEIGGLWGRVIKDGRPLLTNDPPNHPDSSGIPEGHPPLTSFLGVPLKQGDSTVGMISLANKKNGYSETDVKAVESLSLAMSQALRSKRAELKLAQQAHEIMELSTPVVQIWEGVVVAPLIGTLDSERTRQFMERFLETIVRTNSVVALLDITGVPMVDTQTAQHVIEAITAARLLGAEVVLTGVRPEIAQTLVHLGIDLSGMLTRSSLAAGIKVAFSRLGLSVVAGA